MKFCSRCKKLQPMDQFPYKKQTGKPDSWCKTCNKETTTAYKRTLVGIIQSIYRAQLSSSDRRNHPRPTYSREWLTAWVFAQNNWKDIYDAWVGSNYSKDKVPSIDRLNDNLPYTETNIRLTTWAENNDLGKNCYRKHKNPKIGTQVDQLDMEGNYIKTYPNTVYVAEMLGCSRGEISRVCRGKRQSCHNYKWRYTNDATN